MIFNIDFALSLRAMFLAAKAAPTSHNIRYNIFLMAMALGYKSLIKIRCVSHFHVPQSCMSWAQVA